jgi:hypothetical protein
VNGALVGNPEAFSDLKIIDEDSIVSFSSVFLLLCGLVRLIFLWNELWSFEAILGFMIDYSWFRS